MEVHQQAATWFWDQEVFDFVAAQLHLIEQHSLRIYFLAWERKSAGLDWRSFVLNRCFEGLALEIAKLKADPAFATEEDRVNAFMQAGLGKRATYYNHAKKLRSAAAQPIPQITLTQTRPPGAAEPPNVLDTLRQRFGQLGNG